MSGNSIAYLVDQDPWTEVGYTTNNGINDSLNTVFGAGDYDEMAYTTSVFTSQYQFVYIDGSDQNQAFESFMENPNNQTLMANWVAAGGHLYINAGTNYNVYDDINVGFGVQLESDDYDDAAPTAYATDPNSAIVNGPYGNAGTSWTGNGYFALDEVVGGNLTQLIYGDLQGGGTGTALGYESYGLGMVTIGGISAPYFVSPQPQANILEENILDFASGGIGLPPSQNPLTISGTVGNQAGTDDDQNGELQPLSGVIISDSAANAQDSITLTLSGGDANGTLSGPDLTYIGPGTYQLTTEDPDDATYDLEQVIFTPTSGEVPLGQSVTTDITIAVTDGSESATDSTTSLVITAVFPQDIEYGADGATGLSPYAGQAGGAANATAFGTGVYDGYTDAEAYGGNGGNGGAGRPAGGNGGPGGKGGSADATATSAFDGGYGYQEAAEADALAQGGDGGSPGAPASGNGTPGNGGAGGSATASADTYNLYATEETNASAYAEATGGTGGTAFGTGYTGGAGGAVSGTTATALGDEEADATAIQQGGAGGAGMDGANGGGGWASALTNAVNASTFGGELYLDQEADGGDGGSSDTGNGGNGGSALSDLTFDDATSPIPSQSITVTDFGTGGNGGDGALGGNGGATWDAATITGASDADVTLTTDATGGDAGANGLAGGDAEASATASGFWVDVTATAVGGIGTDTAGKATASATGTGESGTVQSSSATGLTAGNLVTSVDANASATVNGTNNALTQAVIDGTMASVTHAGALAYIDAQPVPSLVASADAAAPNTTAAAGPMPTVLAVGALGGGHASQGTDTETSSASTDITVDLLQLPTTPDLYLGFYHPSVIGGAGISDINLTVAADGTNLISQDFATAAAAQSWFNDNPIDLGSLASGPLAASSSLDLSIALGVTTTQAGSYFTTGVLLAYAS